MCAINPGFLSQVNDDIGSIFARIKAQERRGSISNVREAFVEKLKDYFAKFEYDAKDINIFANHVYGMIYERPMLVSKTGDFSIAELESLIQNKPLVKTQEDAPSKTDVLDNQEETEFNPLQPLDVLYGTSSPKTQLLFQFRMKLPELVLIDYDKGIEITNQEQANAQIHKYQSELFRQARDWALKNLPKNSSYIARLENAELYDINDNYTGALQILNEATAKIQQDNYKPNVLERLYKGSTGVMARRSVKEQLQFLNNMAILNNFDSLLANFLKKSINITEGLENIYASGLNKYQLVYTNTNATTTWRNDDHDINAINETSDIVKMLATIPEVDSKGNPMPNRFISLQQIGLLNTKIKEIAHKLKHTSSDNKKLDFRKYRKAHDLMGNTDFDTLLDLILNTAYDQVEGARLLYTYLNFAGESLRTNLTKQDIAQIKSIYKSFFDLENPNSLYSIYLRSLETDNHDISNPPRHYYTYITQMMYTQERIEQQEYTNEDGDINSKTLAETGELSKTYFIDTMLNGVFNVNAGYTPENYQVFRGINKNKNGNSFEYTNEEWGDDVESPAISIRLLGTPFELIRVGKADTSNVIIRNVESNAIVNYSDIGIEPFRKLIKEVLNIDADKDFMEIFTQNQSDDYPLQLVNMVASILYNFEVSKHLKSLQDKYKGTANAINEETYKSMLDQYFSEDYKPNIQRTSTQLGYSNKQYVNVKKQIAKTIEIKNGILSGNIVRDADGKQISSIGLSQLATKIQNQLNEARKFSERNPNTVSNVTSSWVINEAFIGQEFARDYTGPNGNKSAVDFTKKENFVASFVYDYMSNIYGDDVAVKFMPSVISDKSRILKAKFNFNSVVKINGETKFLKDLSIEEIQQLTTKELGDYYQAIYNHASGVFNTLSLAINQLYGITLDYNNNFQNFNSWLDARFNGNSSEKTKFIKSVLHDVIQVVQKTNPEFKLTQNVHYNIDRSGNLQGNAMLFDQLYRWGSPVVTQEVKAAYGLDSGYGKASNFFAEKQAEFLSGLIYEDAQIRTLDGNFKEFNSVGIKALKDNKDWVSGENIVFGTIKYTTWNKDGNLEERTLKITDKDSILRSRIYQDLTRQLNYPQYAHLKERVLVGSPKFNINALAEAIDIYTESQISSARLYNTAISSKKGSKVFEALNNLYTAIYGTDPNDMMEVSDRKHFIESVFDEQYVQDYLNSGNPKNITEIIQNKIGEIDANLKPYVQAVETAIKTELKEKVLEYSTKRKQLEEKHIKASIEIHPELKRYQAFDYWMSQTYMNVSVGTHLNHPGKGSSLKEMESQAWGQQVKRNVSLSASKHLFAQNLLDGIRDRYTIAIIEDDKDVVSNIFGQVGSAKPFDGATFCSIVTNYLENNSLKGDMAGVDKKQFVHDWDPVTGTGVIIKTAGFAITNARIRDSKFLNDLNYRMLNRTISETGIDITQAYDGKPINYGEFYYKEGNTYYKVPENGISYDPASGETIVLRQRLNRGVWGPAEPKRVVVRSNYDAWKEVFGGEYSMEMGANNNLVPSENSAKLLTFAVNNVGTVKPGVTQVTNQSQVNQIMKQALIDYVVTEGAIKQGASNVNSKEAYFNRDIHLNTMSISTKDAGIQLDAEHHADESTLSLMTQVVNALGARGYTAKQAQGVYKALQGLVSEALHDYTEGLKGNQELLDKFISKVVIDAVASNDVSTEGNLIQAITKQIQDSYKGAGRIMPQEILDNFPLDNPQVLTKSVSQISSYLTKKTVRIKFPGSMDVLNPSNRIYLLYDGRPLSFYNGDVSNLGFREVTDVSDVELGRTYKITDLVSGATFSKKVETPTDYYDLIDALRDNGNLSIEEDLAVGRDLGTYNVRFRGVDENGIEMQYNMWDLDTVKDLYTKDKQLSNLVKNLKKANSVLETLIAEGKDTTLQETLISGILDEIYAIGESVGIQSENPKQIHNFMMQQLQKTLNDLSAKRTVKVRGIEVQIVGELKKQAYELICGAMYKTDFGLTEGDDVAEISEDVNFFVKRAVSNFTPKVSDTLYDVELKVLNGNHVYLLDGNNTLPNDSTLQRVPIRTRNINGETVRIDIHGNKLYSMSSDEDAVYQDSKGNQIIVTKNMDYYINKTNFVTVGLSPRVTRSNYNINYLVTQLLKSDKPAVAKMMKNLSRTPITRKDKSEEEFKLAVQESKNAIDPIIDQLQEYIKQNGTVPDETSELGQQLINTVLPNFQNFIEDNHNKTHQELQRVHNMLNSLKPGEAIDIDSIKSYSLKNVITSGQEIHTSFLKSLNVLAARIPAQSHQSFMAMKIVGFDHSGLNSAYVNRMQIWLQGSDFDIDKVSLLGYQFRNGKLVKWSHLMSLRTPAELAASEDLPFPTSEEVEIQSGPESEINAVGTIIQQMITVPGGGISYNRESGKVEFLLNQRTSEDRSLAIRNMTKLIETVNDLGYFPDITEGIEGEHLEIFSQVQNLLLKEINKHNTFTHSKGINPKEALINFISTSMYNTSINPINLIQGQTPIDNPVDEAKELAKPMPMNERSKLFSPGNPLSKMEQLILTLEGKKNTGIVASAMKVFEAISQYNYITLQSSDQSAQERLLIDRSIIGKEIELIANAYVEDNPELSETVRYALSQVNNDEDAFILYSALLSLSTDNAKDPTLAKINAGPTMMGLYTAGLTLGLNLEILIPIMTSDIGWEISGLLESDVFNDTKGEFGIDGALKYIQEGPLREFRTLPDAIKNQIKLLVAEFLNSKVAGKGTERIDLKQLENDLKYKRKTDLTKKFSDDFTMAIIRSGNFNLEKGLFKLRNDQELSGEELLLKTEETLEYRVSKNLSDTEAHLEKLRAREVKSIDSLIEKRDAEGLSKRQRDYYQKEIDKFTKQGYAKYNKKVLKQIETAEKELAVLKEVQQYINNDTGNATTEIVEYVEQLQQEIQDGINETATEDFQVEISNYQDKSRLKLSRFLKSLRKYKRISKTAQRSWIKSAINGKSYKALDVIKQLNQMANEQSRLRPITTLNQSLPNDIPSMMKFLRDFENIMDDRFEEIPSKEKQNKGLKEVYEEFVKINSAMLGEDSSKVDFNRFVTDQAYRQFIVNVYDKLKFGVNIFDVMQSNPHYFGYMKAANTQFEMFKSLSKVYRVVDGISKSTLSQFIKSSKDNQKYIKKTQKFVTSRLNNKYLLSQGKIISISSGKVYDKSGNIHDVTTPTEILLGTPEGNATFKYWMDNVVIPELKKTRFINDFISGLTKMENGKTYNGKGLISYGLNINMFPKTDDELREFKRYKVALANLQQDVFDGHNVGDLLFYYNLISYNGEMTNGSLTGLFEDIIAEKSSKAANDFMLFYSQFGKEGQFIEGLDYTEDELLRYIATEENLATNKMPYAIAYNTDTMEKVLVKKKEKEISEDKLPEELRSMVQENQEARNEEQSRVYAQLESLGIDPSQDKSFAKTLDDAGYEMVDDSTNFSQDFTNNYVNYQQSSIPLSGRIQLVGVDLTSISGDIEKVKEAHMEQAKFVIGRKSYSLSDLVAQAKQNGYQDVTKDDFIVYQQKFNVNGDNELVIDVEQTRSRIEEVFQENCK